MIYRLRVFRFVFLCAAVMTLVCASVAAAGGYKLGDADRSGEVNVMDATSIQKTLIGVYAEGGIHEKAADVDGNGEIEIIDATFVLRWAADIETPYPVGTQFDLPTEAPTQMPTDEDGWGRVIFRP